MWRAGQGAAASYYLLLEWDASVTGARTPPLSLKPTLLSLFNKDSLSRARARALSLSHQRLALARSRALSLPPSPPSLYLLPRRHLLQDLCLNVPSPNGRHTLTQGRMTQVNVANVTIVF